MSNYEQHDKTSQNINQKSKLTITFSSSSNFDTNSDFTSISNLNIFNNSKLKILIITFVLFDFLCILGSIIFSILDTNYILNIIYLEKDQNNYIIKNNDFSSVFTINKYMLYTLLYSLLILEFIELLLLISKRNLKMMSRYVYIEMGYWFFVIKFLYGVSILSMTFHFLDFYLDFTISIILNISIISKI